MLSIRSAWKWVAEYIGPLFVIFEAGMHVYLAIYLFLNWTNGLIWLFTLFEMTMFLYLLITKKKGGVLRGHCSRPLETKA